MAKPNRNPNPFDADNDSKQQSRKGLKPQVPTSVKKEDAADKDRFASEGGQSQGGRSVGTGSKQQGGSKLGRGGNAGPRGLSGAR